MTKWRLAAIGAGVSLLAGLGTPASATGTSMTDSSGQDFNPASTTVAGTEVANTHDGSSADTDLIDAQLDAITTTGGQKRLRATFKVDGSLPGCPATAGTCTEGAGLPSDFDGPDASFVGGSYKLMFQNKNKMHNGDNTATGCARVGGGRVRDQGGHWADGYHQYIAMAVTNSGSTWSYTPQVGEYDPSPDGAFFFTDLESEPNMVGDFSSSITWDGTDTTIVVEVASILETGEITCVGGVHQEDIAAEAADGRPGPYATSGGDVIANVSGLTTADQIIVLPVTVPLSVVPGESDLKAVGGFIYFADNTNRTSTTPNDPVYSGGELGVSDTLGDGPTCPTPTFGGTVQDNPLWAANQNQACQVDDDAVGNTLLSEFRSTTYGFTVDF